MSSLDSLDAMRAERVVTFLKGYLANAKGSADAGPMGDALELVERYVLGDDAEDDRIVRKKLRELVKSHDERIALDAARTLWGVK